MTPGEAALAETEQRARAAVRPALRVVQEEPPSGDGPGARLAAARILTGRSIQDAAAALRLKPRHLIAIEAEDFGRLPGLGYALGFVRAYADYLEVVEVETLLARFRARWEATLGDSALQRAAPLPQRRIRLPISALVAIAFTGWLALWAVGHALWSGNQSTDDSALDASVRAWMQTQAPPPAAGPMVALPARTLIRVTQPEWLEVRATDGSVVVSRVFTPEERFSPDGYGDWSLYTTNAAHVRVSIDGIELPPLGAEGRMLQGWRPPAPAPAPAAAAPAARLPADEAPGGPAPLRPVAGP